LAHVNTVVHCEPAPPDDPPLELDEPIAVLGVDEHEAAPATAQETPARRPIAA
jgi:hypothetical protein